jgi:hypothetical protein
MPQRTKGADMNAFKLGSIGGAKREMHRLLWVTVAAAAVGLAVGGVSLASQGAANDSNPLVVKLLSRATAIDNFVDTGPAGPGAQATSTSGRTESCSRALLMTSSAPPTAAVS